MDLDRIVYGGSFDPPHKGHSKLLQFIIKNYSHSQLIVMIAANPPHKKKSIVDSQKRLEMMSIFINQMQENREKIIVCDYELKQKRTSYTIHTSRWLRRKYNDEKIAFLIGDDLLKDLHNWKEIDEIFQSHPFLVYPRKNSSYENHETIEKLQREYPHAQIDLLTAPIFTCSSEKIRQRLHLLQNLIKTNLWNYFSRKNEMRKLLQYLDGVVLHYILKNHLYA